MSDSSYYTCPMHEEVVERVPGKCPTCKMDLVEKHNTTDGAVYTCPMHPEVEQYQPGDCPTCKMHLQPKK